MLFTKTYKVYLSKTTHKNLDMFLEQQRSLWNMGMEYCVSEYEQKKKSTSYFDLCKKLTELRKLNKYKQFHLHCQRTTYNRLGKAFQNFFRRIKKGQTPGFPRFKGEDRKIRSFETDIFIIKQCNKYNAVNIKGIGKFRFKGDLPENIKFIRIVKTPIRIKIQLIHEKISIIYDDSREPLGIDVGVKTRMTLSNGFQVKKRVRNRNKVKKFQRRISKCRKGSNNRAKIKIMKQKEEQRVQEKELGYLHELTTNLIKTQSSKFVVEDLDIKSIVEKNKSKDLNRNIMEQTWGLFYRLLVYKAENAGGWVKQINPKNTTQKCSFCGHIPEVKLTLEDRIYDCIKCGYSMDRDLNASLNILRAGTPRSLTAEKYAKAA